MANYGGYEWAQGRAVHRWVWEQTHGPIPRGGIIHHIDGDPANNAPENLMLVMSRRDHMRVHRGWELREDGWWRPRHVREDTTEPMVKHLVDAPPPRRTVVRVVSSADFDSILAVAKDPYRTMLLLQWAVGLRPGEVCKLRMADLDLDGGRLTTPYDGKTGERVLYFDVNGRAAEALRGWMQQRGVGPYVFGGADRVKANTYTVTLWRYCDRAGVRRIKPYTLRHSYACELMDSGNPIATISAALGHKEVATTALFYLHPNPELQRSMNKGR